MEYLILKFVERLDIIDLLPYKMGRIIVDSEIVIGQDLKDLSPVCRCRHQILSARPLIFCKEHGAVFDRHFHAFSLCVFQDWRPHFLYFLQVRRHTLVRDPSDKCCDHIYIQHYGRIDQLVEMINITLAFLQIRVHSVRIICKSGNLNSLCRTQILDLFCFLLCKIRNIDMADSCISALCSALRPARDFQALQTILCGEVNNFLKCHSFTD